MVFARYRLPYADTYTEVRYNGDPILLHAYEDLQGKEGFVIAPSCISKDSPLVLIPAKGADISDTACIEASPKSISEIACNGAAPAIGIAIHDAVGVWVRSWPMTPEKILRAMGKIK